MSIMEPTVEQAEQIFRNKIETMVISREEFPTEIVTKIFFSELLYTLGVVISHDNFEKKYIYKTFHSSPKNMLKDDALNKSLIKDMEQFTLDYFDHCMNERQYTTTTLYHFNPETGKLSQSKVREYAKT